MLFFVLTYGQQEPQYSQYMYNMSTVNPGYVTNQNGMVSTGILYRKQWTSIQGSPQTANVFANIPLNEKLEVSINYVNDNIGDAINVKNDFVNADVAYITRLSDKFRLSGGLKVGLNSLQVNALDSNVSDDPAFADNASQLNMTLGAGLFLFANNFYAGVSTPNLLPNDAELGEIGVAQTKTHLYAISGYVFDISSDVKLKPSTVIKQVIDSPLTFDVSLNSLLFNRFELGVSYRYQDAFIALAGFSVTQNLKIGYSYDFSTSDLSGYNNGSHEIILLYNFDLLNFSKTFTSPRFY